MSSMAKTVDIMKKHPGQVDTEAGAADIHKRAAAAAAELQKAGIMGAGGQLDLGKFNEAMSAMSEDSKKTFMKGMPGFNDSASAGMLSAALIDMFNKVYKPEIEKEKADTDHKNTGAVNKVAFTGDIHITQDFKDQDPDRVWISFKNGMERQAENALGSNLSEKFGT
jgi:hypothetical protein